ncbi:MAG: hypothetical protein ACM31L_09860 [Actinomycetota bacterium]
MVLSISITAPVSAQSSQSSQAAFHPAKHPAEKWLARLLKRAEYDGSMVFYVVGAPFRDQRKDVNYHGLFSQSLEADWAAAEASEVDKNCGGRYIDGEICGLDFDPLVCGQDVSEKGYLFHTDNIDENSATITMRWPWIEKPLATYRLRKLGKKWVLDGVACLPDGPAFNMPVSGDTARQ